MAYAADPGGVFDSDTHRRVAGHLPLPGDDPTELHALGHRISPDANHGLQTVDELADVLQDLEAGGYASNSASGWKLTKKGLDALMAPLPEEPQGPVRPALLGGLEAGGNSGG